MVSYLDVNYIPIMYPAKCIVTAAAVVHLVEPVRVRCGRQQSMLWPIRKSFIHSFECGIRPLMLCGVASATAVAEGALLFFVCAFFSCVLFVLSCLCATLGAHRTVDENKAKRIYCWRMRPDRSVYGVMCSIILCCVCSCQSYHAVLDGESMRL